MRFNRYRVVAIGLAALSLSGCSYRKFAEQERGIKEEWAQVRSELQRRNDVIPPLIEKVRSSAPDQESVCQTAVDSRARLVAARTAVETIDAANQQSLTLERLMAIVEQHPELRANDSFKRLMDELAAAQNGIAVERMRYNARVQRYNISRRQFPGMLTADLFFHDFPFFEVPPPPRDGPKAEIDRQPQP